MLTISTGEVRVRLLLLSSEFHLDGINSTSEEMDGGDLAWSAPPDCLSNNEGPPHLPPDCYNRRVSQTWKASSP